MKIIFEGQRPEEVAYQATCGNCKCVFQFAAKEAERISGGQREGDYFKIGCPTCARPVTRDVRP